jgi:hypothetical protein
MEILPNKTAALRQTHASLADSLAEIYIHEHLNAIV